MAVMLLPSVKITNPRSFLVVRTHDVSGVSGVGVVAEGTEWSDGSCSVRWLGDDPCTQNWETGIESFLKIHGHGGKTYIMFLEDPGTKVTYPESFQRPGRGRTLVSGAEH
jgi:hypothetical protein